MPILIFIFFLLIPVTAQAGEFFPPEYKQFQFKEGDLLVSKRSNGKFAVNKILKVDRFDFKKGTSINIQGKKFTATDDDYLLVVSAAFGASEFKSLKEASSAANAGHWTVKVAHAPNRTVGAAEGQTYVGHQQVRDTELVGYKKWRQAFDEGKAGVF